jgi:hypothetical protein
LSSIYRIVRMKGKFYNHTSSIAKSQASLNDLPNHQVICIPKQTQPPTTKTKLSFRDKSEPKLYIWKSSIPSKWFKIRGEANFKRVNRNEDFKRGNLDYLCETFRYINKITQPIPSTRTRSRAQTPIEEDRSKHVGTPLPLERKLQRHNRVKSMPVFTNRQTFNTRPYTTTRYMTLPHNRKAESMTRPVSARNYSSRTLRRENSIKMCILSRESSKRSYLNSEYGRFENLSNTADILAYINTK